MRLLLILALFCLSLLQAEYAFAEKEPVSEAGPSDAQSNQAKPETEARPTIFHRRILRKGFHFHASLGVGGGPDTAGIYHAMEIGWSFKGYTIAFLHTLIQNKNELGTDKGGPDEIGGFMLQLQGPLYFDDLVWKVASGVGGTVSQPDDGGFYPQPGFGVHYGVDLHFPIWPKFGPTLSFACMNVYSRQHHHFGASAALGITVF